MGMGIEGGWRRKGRDRDRERAGKERGKVRDERIDGMGTCYMACMHTPSKRVAGDEWIAGKKKSNERPLVARTRRDDHGKCNARRKENTAVMRSMQQSTAAAHKARHTHTKSKRSKITKSEDIVKQRNRNEAHTKSRNRNRKERKKNDEEAQEETRADRKKNRRNKEQP